MEKEIEQSTFSYVCAIAWRICVMATIVLPLILLIVKAYDRSQYTYKVLTTTDSQEKQTEKPKQDEKSKITSGSQQKPTTPTPPPDNSKTSSIPTLTKPTDGKQHAIIYASSAANPATLGHMTMIATAIDFLVKQNFVVDRVLFSLSDEPYLRGKVANLVQQGKQRICLSNDQRKNFLNDAIDEAAKRNMFHEVPVQYWNDQDEGYSDHPDSYRRLAKVSPVPVFFVAGEDAVTSMKNWRSGGNAVQNVIVVSRGSAKAPQGFNDHLPAGYQRHFVPSRFEKYEKISSSAVQEGTAKLEPQWLQEEFEKIQKFHAAHPELSKFA